MSRPPGAAGPAAGQGASCTTEDKERDNRDCCGEPTSKGGGIDGDGNLDGHA